MIPAIDQDRYLLHQADAPQVDQLVTTARAALEKHGLFNLPGFLNATALAETLATLTPRFQTQAFRHARRHTIYFKDDVPGLDQDHPAMRRFETVNHTLPADRLQGTCLPDLHRWPPFVDFLARTMGKDRLYPLDDPLAAVNVMAYGAGEALNWHFDRSEFTTTLLLQAPEGGGAFEYARNLRTDESENHDGVARLIDGDWPTEEITLAPGTLNVFRGRNTAHRVTPIEGETARIIAVFSYADQPGQGFSDAERLGFYGRKS